MSADWNKKPHSCYLPLRRHCTTTSSLRYISYKKVCSSHKYQISKIGLHREDSGVAEWWQVGKHAIKSFSLTLLSQLLQNLIHELLPLASSSEIVAMCIAIAKVHGIVASNVNQSIINSQSIHRLLLQNSFLSILSPYRGPPPGAPPRIIRL